MKIKHFINLHKALTAFYILGLMMIYDNFTLAPCVYLALHGTYGIIWLFKDRIYPDQQWEENISLLKGLSLFIILGLYWVAPFILISRTLDPSNLMITFAIMINLFGVFFHYSSDAQKYYTLKYRKGLITEGFFARCRNTNYLGEFLIYFSFALLAQHWLPFVILGLFTALIFVPNMLKKDQSLSRYSEFKAYQESSGLFIPKFLITSQKVEVTSKS